MSKRRTTRRAPRRIQRLATPEERAYVATFSRDHSSVWRFGGWLFGILGLSIAVLLLSVDLPYWMPAVALLTGAAISWLSFRAAKTLASPDSDEDVHVVELKGPLEILDAGPKDGAAHGGQSPDSSVVTPESAFPSPGATPSTDANGVRQAEDISCSCRMRGASSAPSWFANVVFGASSRQLREPIRPALPQVRARSPSANGAGSADRLRIW